ncbi:hypothetical protein A3732_08345 [Oleiphilus sp. HI0050]|nr:hypothetical protein A3732_08345 [Oleiphilus sp. HI0050]
MNKSLKKLLFRYMSDKMIGYNHYRTHKDGIRCWAESGNLLFLHVPKAAGTSINKSLNMPDVGHYTYKELCEFDFRFKEKSSIFLVYRSPVSRLMSTYRYAKKAELQKGYSSLSKVSKYATFDQFIDTYLNVKRIRDNYFFKPVTDFICGADLDRVYIVNFDKLAEGYNYVLENFDMDPVKLPLSNTTSSSALDISQTSIDKINRLYASDIVLEKALNGAPYINGAVIDL